MSIGISQLEKEGEIVVLHLSSVESLDSASAGFKQLLGETQHLLLDLIVRSLGIGLLEHREAEHVPGNHSFFQG